MDYYADRITVWILFILLLVTTIFLAHEHGMETLGNKEFISVEISRQIKETVIPPVVHGKYVDVRIEGGTTAVKEKK